MPSRTWPAAAAAAAVRERVARISALAGAFRSVAASARSLSDPAAAGVLAGHGAERLSGRGAPVVAVAGASSASDAAKRPRGELARLDEAAATALPLDEAAGGRPRGES